MVCTGIKSSSALRYHDARTSIAFTAAPLSRIKWRDRLLSIHGKCNFLLLPWKVFDSVSIRAEWSDQADTYRVSLNSARVGIDVSELRTGFRCYSCPDRFYDHATCFEFRTLRHPDLCLLTLLPVFMRLFWTASFIIWFINEKVKYMFLYQVLAHLEFNITNISFAKFISVNF